MSITKISPLGLAFVADHEGFVSKAYLCPAGVLTIGYGFTMGSKVFAQYWRNKHGRALRIGDTIGHDEARMLLPKVVDEEYGSAVVRNIGPKVQHHYDGSASMTFNCGIGATLWRWAKALAVGQVREAADLMRTTAVTANGRRLAGLVRRRAEEADIVQNGRYKNTEGASVSVNTTDVKWYQIMLQELGIYNLRVDGIAGPVTLQAVRDFQKSRGLVVDGIVGPATRAALIRAVDEKRTGSAGVGSGVLTGGGTATHEIVQTQSFDFGSVLGVLGFGITAFIVVVAVSYVFRNRGKLLGTGRVPT